MGSNITIDWVSAKRWYIEGTVGADGVRRWPKMEDIAAKYGLAKQTVFNRGNNDHWAEARVKHQHDVAKAAAAKSLKAATKALVTFDSTCMDASTEIVRQVGQHLKIAGNEPLKPGDLRILASTLSLAQGAGRLAAGASTLITDSTVTSTNLEIREVAPELKKLTDAELQSIAVAKELLKRVSQT